MLYLIKQINTKMYFLSLCSMDEESQGCDGQDYTLQATQALEVMRKRLPPHIINCFVASGYETLSTIADMDVSGQPGDSISVIEEYIGKMHAGDPTFSHASASAITSATSTTGATASATTPAKFVFPPGHREIITKLVKEVKRLQNTHQATLKRKRSSDSSKKRQVKKLRTEDDNCAAGCSSDQSTFSPASAYQCIRQKVVKWARQQKDDRIKTLKEHDDYEIKISVYGNNQVNTSILCNSCGQVYKLAEVDKGSIKLSNWTRHVKRCFTAKSKSGKAKTIKQYFPVNVPPAPQEFVLADQYQHFRLPPPRREGQTKQTTKLTSSIETKSNELHQPDLLSICLSPSTQPSAQNASSAAPNTAGCSSSEADMPRSFDHSNSTCSESHQLSVGLSPSFVPSAQNASSAAPNTAGCSSSEADMPRSFDHSNSTCSESHQLSVGLSPSFVPSAQNASSAAPNTAGCSSSEADMPRSFVHSNSTCSESHQLSVGLSPSFVPSAQNASSAAPNTAGCSSSEADMLRPVDLTLSQSPGCPLLIQPMVQNSSFGAINSGCCSSETDMALDITMECTPLNDGQISASIVHSDSFESTASFATTDWSRSSRNRLALLKAASDTRQTKMTSYYNQIIDTISEFPCISEVLNKAPMLSEGDNYKSVRGLLKNLLVNAEKNALKVSSAMRHETIIKKFATSLLIYCGPLAYNFLHCNLAKALPSLRTVQRSFEKDYKPFCEGIFRFDELLAHLTAYNAAKIVACGEDATRLISRVEYDSESNKLVGFVLPCNDNSLPNCDAFIANTFEAIEDAFKSGVIAKYAFVYMVQPLTKGVPAFCLACLGSDNRFSNELVAKRWKHIREECHKRGIIALSFGADGDSRELRAMQLSTQLCLSRRQQKKGNDLPTSIAVPVKISPTWSTWFAMQNPTEVAYVQDVVHVAVKLKSRLLKPSIALPLGNYLAGLHDLRMIQSVFGKDQHGIRERDINHKDKQNFDAVLRLTSDSVMTLLSQIPDAKGTRAYLTVVKHVMDSFLDKGLDPLSRIEKIWYAVFFVRYWRWWLTHHPNYTLGSNFITQNAYVCIELNAHALIVFLMKLRDSNCDESFCPWMLGSQSCERIFRTARSMSSTFSTIINFGMLGLLRRLHRLHTQICLEAESERTGIKYPSVEAHKSKDGCNKQVQHDSLPCNEEILKSVEKAKKLAQEMMETLGMAKLLQDKKCWEYPPIPTVKESEINDGDDDNEDDDDAVTDQVIPYLLQEGAISHDESGEISNGINKLSSMGIIDKGLNEHLTTLHQKAFKRSPSTSLPMYDMTEDSSKASKKKQKFSPYVQVHYGEKSTFIHKSTAVWLLQEGERVSSDRLFRVRGKQPFAIDRCNQKHHSENVQPVVSEVINIGDICVFTISQQWRLGRVLKFSYFHEKTKKRRQYAGSSVNLSDDNIEKIGVLCSWYTSSGPNKSSSAVVTPVLTKACSEMPHAFQPVLSYLCTTSYSCFEWLTDDETSARPSILSRDQSLEKLVTSDNLTLKSSTLSFIQTCMNNQSTREDNATPVKTPSTWLTIGKYVMTKKDKQDVLTGKELKDQHVSVYLSILKEKFPHICGLQNTILQQRDDPAIQRENGQMLLQVIHIRKNHWALIQVVKNEEVLLYDSAYNSTTDDTVDLITKLVHSPSCILKISIMNTAKQTGATDCALFALATVTSLALGSDPLQVVLDQSQLRSHYITSIESRSISFFPTLKRRRVADRISSSQEYEIFCYCRMVNDGEKMVCCDTCEIWHHRGCIEDYDDDSEEPWFCKYCKLK